MISPKLVEVGRHLNINLITCSEIEYIAGESGNFQVKLKRNPRYIDLEKCTACGECVNVCPIDVPNQFDEGLSDRKAVFKLYAQGMPSGYVIDKRTTAPCKASCPANVSVQGYIALINQGKYEESIRLFRDVHPFPGSCGRVCHHPCEKGCTRGDLDEAVSIREIHRFLADWEGMQGVSFPPETADIREEKVAVIGSGPAGLSAAYFLVRNGYPVTVFEKLPVVGGMMAVGIPSYRLPRHILVNEVSLIEDMGVSIETGVTFGEDITLESLRRDGFSAVFLGVGLHNGQYQESEFLGSCRQPGCGNTKGERPGTNGRSPLGYAEADPGECYPGNQKRPCYRRRDCRDELRP